MKDQLVSLKEKILSELAQIKQLSALENLENQFLGRKGELTNLLKRLPEVAVTERKAIGQLANEIKVELTGRVAEVREKFESHKAQSAVDATLPGLDLPRGHLHPMTIVQKELEELFMSMGFAILDGPELESDYYNFEGLNIPPHHPARDMQDTFYIDKKNKDDEYDLVMRTQTSSVQVRAMQKYGAPLRCAIPGRCFRSEATDVRHEHTFYQLEGLMVDKNISFANMKGVLEAVAQRLYGPETKVRLRPKFYPFVEPGSNGEVTCFLCKGQGCRLCKQTGWLEVFGSGMVHPNVLKAGGIDPTKYQGFAFGFGLTRLVMLKYNINDIRLLQSSDIRFLEQF
ncbi:phenylalanine--tRNA ligase subunit alpha [Candidatus Falkowbacteria bacterium]|nr:phenylalanine--tRNA ligase subunit alpha [Candidatus Falkowbacteria bacterium]